MQPAKLGQPAVEEWLGLRDARVVPDGVLRAGVQTHGQVRRTDEACADVIALAQLCVRWGPRWR